MTVDQHTTLAFVDVETTGTSPRYHRVIEVGIVRVEPGKSPREYRTFVDIGAHVPAYITSLTGISSAMLVGQPLFEEVAREIAALLEGALFVAHNAPFDYGFLGEEFRRAGLSFSYPYLCTAKLSRALFPHERHHKVSSLIERYDLAFESRHRALDDARVLHQFIEKSRDLLGDERVYTTMQEMVRLRRLPLHIKEDKVARVPDTTGVYFFYGKGDALLYVGKSRKMRTRVRAHFTVDALSGRGQDMLSEVRRIEYRETSGELGALLLESHLIKTLGPTYNLEARERHVLCVATQSRDARGYERLTLAYADPPAAVDHRSIAAVFKSKASAKEQLAALAQDYELCPHLVGLEKHAPCSAHELGRCRGACVEKEKPRHHNQRLREAFDRHRIKAWPFPGPVAIEERDRSGRRSLYILDQWQLLAALEERGGAWETLVPPRFHFDHDVYKIFARELFKSRPRFAVRPITTAEVEWLETLSIR